MTITIPKFIASFQLFNKAARISSTHPKVYCTLNPAQSPMFVTPKEVTNWFKLQSEAKKQAFYKLGFFTIYSHELALCNRILPNGQSVKKGEAFNMEEAKMWDFAKKAWL
jgi:hypothetical protein